MVKEGEIVGKSPRLVVIPDTGEIDTVLNHGDRILRATSIEYLKGYQEWRIEHFYKGNIDEVRGQLASLSINERAFLFSVVTYIGYNDCCIKHDNGKEMSMDSLVVLTKMKKTLLYQTIESLRRKDIIYKGKNSQGDQFFMNPWLFARGNQINRVLKTMFKNYRIKVLDDKAWGDVKD